MSLLALAFPIVLALSSPLHAAGPDDGQDAKNARVEFSETVVPGAESLGAVLKTIQDDPNGIHGRFMTFDAQVEKLKKDSDKATAREFKDLSVRYKALRDDILGAGGTAGSSHGGSAAGRPDAQGEADRAASSKVSGAIAGAQSMTESRIAAGFEAFDGGAIRDAAASPAAGASRTAQASPRAASEPPERGLRIAEVPAPGAAADDRDAAAREHILGHMTLVDKVRETLIATVSPNQPYTGGGIYFGDHLKQLAKSGSAPQFQQNCKKFGGYTDCALQSADQEGGRVDRFKSAGYQPMPSPAEMAQLPPEQVRKIAASVVDHARATGVNMVYAPVLDLQNPNKGNPEQFSGWDGNKDLSSYDSSKELSRRYSSDPRKILDTASTYLAAAKERVAQLRKENPGKPFDVLFVGKHFPGESHPVDSDDANIRQLETRREMEGRIGIYRELAKRGLIDAVMVSNNEYPAAFGPGPAITRENVVNEARGMGLVTTTDDTTLPRRRKAGEDVSGIAIKSFEAGNTFVMTCDDGPVRKKVEADLVRHIARHPELAEKLDQHVLEVLRLKQRVGLISAN